MIILKQARENIGKAQDKQKKDFDKRHHCPNTFKVIVSYIHIVSNYVPSNLKVGTIVLKKDMTRKKRKGGKLDTKWTGPFKITASLGRGLYQLSHHSNAEILIPCVNEVHLKKYSQPSRSPVS